MKVTPTGLPGVLVLEPKVFRDSRGEFMESFNQRSFEAATGLAPRFVQDNYSRSLRNVLRGLHYQVRQQQDKLVWVAQGAVFDVAVDVRRSSPTFGRWFGTELSSANRRQLWIPAGFAHGFLVLSESADVLYKATDFHAPEHERGIVWDDPGLAIEWPQRGGRPLLSAKDAAAVTLAEAELPPASS